MYYFTIAGMECRCETAEELRAVVGQPVSTPARPTATATTRARTGRRAKKSHHRRSPAEAAATAAGTETDTSGNADAKKVPYITGGITWDVAKKHAKKLGRTDIRQVRSDLKQRQLAGR